MQKCQVFTPPDIVQKMLDMVDYAGDNIASKTIFEPSFGDGAFLLPIVQRILTYCTEHNKNKDETVKILSNVHGIELDKKYYDITKKRLTDLLNQYDLVYDWPNLHNTDTLLYSPPFLFDCVIGNPPYLKIHDCSSSTRETIKKNYKMGKGNTDLYVIFYEKGLQCLKDDGVLCYIAPNSYFNNSSQKDFRTYLSHNNLVEEIVDYGEVRVFGAVDTYTAITKLKKKRQPTPTKYTMMDSIDRASYTSEVDLSNYKGSPWTFNTKNTLQWIKDIQAREEKLGDLCEIQYGIATNADAIYVIPDEIAQNLEPEAIRPVVKASKLKEGQFIIFPYEWDEESEKYTPVEETVFQKKYPKTYAYLLSHKDRLEKRDMEKGIPWYAYARSQGLQNSRNKKIAIKHILSPDKTTCEVKEYNAQTLIFSGIYIIVKDEKDYKKVLKILRGSELYKYLFTIGKNMSGGYKNVNAKAIKSYGIPKSERE